MQNLEELIVFQKNIISNGGYLALVALALLKKFFHYY